MTVNSNKADKQCHQKNICKTFQAPIRFYVSTAIVGGLEMVEFVRINRYKATLRNAVNRLKKAPPNSGFDAEWEVLFIVDAAEFLKFLLGREHPLGPRIMFISVCTAMYSAYCTYLHALSLKSYSNINIERVGNDLQLALLALSKFSQC